MPNYCAIPCVRQPDKVTIKSMKNPRFAILATLLLFISFSQLPQQFASSASLSNIETLLNELVVHPEPTRSGYDRSLFPHWIDKDGNKCDTRSEVLVVESVIPIGKSKNCQIYKGRWVSPYDGLLFETPKGIDIDHVVSLAEAWDSGAYTWNLTNRTAFANDITSPWSLVAVSAQSNRSKSDADSANWQPSTKSGRCWLASATTITKWRWSLSVDQAELEKLREVLSSCPNLKVSLPKKIISSISKD